MKTIKLSLLGILYLIITVFLIRYAVITINYITTDFTTTNTKELVNFGLTFAIQSIILIALALICIAEAIGCFSTSYSYYFKWKTDYRNRELLKHIEEQKYEKICANIRSTNDITIKKQYIDEYLGKAKCTSNTPTNNSNSTHNIHFGQPIYKD